MKTKLIATLGLTALAIVATAQGPKQVKAKLMDANGKDAGTVTFKAVKNGVEMDVELKNLAFGKHGVHIHQNAVCDAPEFKGAGGHFNPDGKQHGFDNPAGHHNGDLPKNVEIGEDLTGSGKFVLTTISLDPAAPNSIFANGGTSVVVHEKADDMKTDPSGNSGQRIACAVVKQ